jgi:hypothetical protein
MAQEILLNKRLDSLVPADDVAIEALRRIKLGSTIKAKISSPRNMAFHRKFFAMMQIVLKNQSHYKTMDTLLTVCKIETGHCEVVRTKKHGDIFVPKSIGVTKMTGDEFSAFYDRACDWVEKEVIPGLKRKELDAEVEKELRGFGS